MFPFSQGEVGVGLASPNLFNENIAKMPLALDSALKLDKVAIYFSVSRLHPFCPEFLTHIFMLI
jgi:hypothetical protein